MAYGGSDFEKTTKGSSSSRSTEVIFIFWLGILSAFPSEKDRDLKKKKNLADAFEGAKQWRLWFFFFVVSIKPEKESTILQSGERKGAEEEK